MPCRFARCASCYTDSQLLPFQVQRAFNDESEYYSRRREDEMKYLVARPGDGLLAPFQCESCWFVNIYGRLPQPEESYGDKCVIACLRRANLDVFWSRESSTTKSVVGYLREIVRRAKTAGRMVPLEPFEPWGVEDRQGVGIAIMMLEKSLEKGRNSAKFIQFGTTRQLRGAASNVYAATSQASGLRYAMKSSKGEVTHLYEGAMQTMLMERFVKGMKIRMPEIQVRNNPMTAVMVKYVLSKLEVEFFDPATAADRHRDVLMLGAYMCCTYGHSLRGNEGLWVDADRLCRHIGLGKFDQRGPHVLISLLGRFKSEDGDRMHVFPLANITRSGVRIRVWLERLVKLLRDEGKTGCPAFCDVDSYQLSLSYLEAVMHPFLEGLQKDPLFPNVITKGVDVRVWWRLARSLRRGAEVEALEQGVSDTVIKFVHRWGRYETSRGAEPGFNMLEHYASGAKTRYMHIKFTASL